MRPPTLGRKVHIIGNSCSGKSTLAKRLSDAFGFTLVELDALNWQPNWVGLHENNQELFEKKLISL